MSLHLLSHVLAILAFLAHRACAFCTAYAPLEGSRFSFPKRSCITQKFLDEEFEAGTFGHEPINLASELRNISHKGASFPLSHVVGWGWESGAAAGAVADILLREILGFNTELVCSWGSLHAQKLLAGCSNPMGSDPCTTNGVAQLKPPLAVMSVESWVTTVAENLEMNTYNANLGMVGYYSKNGLYFHREIAEKAFTQEGLVLEWWEPFVKIPRVSQYFDTWSSVTAHLRHWSNGTVEPMCKPGTPQLQRIEDAGYTCEDGWFFGPACAHDKESCIPVILAEFDWNGIEWVNAIAKEGYRFALTWIGSLHSFTYSVRGGMRFLFYCATTTAICHERPLAKIYGDSHMPVGRPDLITSLLKTAWIELPKVEPVAYDFLRRLTIPFEDLETLMLAWSDRANFSKPDELVPTIACNWLQTNAAKWMHWIPRFCSTGQEYDASTGKCRFCAPGKHSPAGDTCVLCPPGFLSDSHGATVCEPCAGGRYIALAGQSLCSHCPEGTYSLTGSPRCDTCSQGTFANSVGQTGCQRCPLGAFGDREGAINCSVCEGGRTTNYLGATTKSMCVCASASYSPLDATRACLECPLGMECAFGSDLKAFASMTSLAALSNLSGEELQRHPFPRVLPGYWTEFSAPLSVFACSELNMVRCPGGLPQSCGGNSDGQVCGECIPDYNRASDSICMKCTPFELSYMLFPCLPMMLITGFVLSLYYRSMDTVEKWNSPRNQIAALVSLLLMYVQTLETINSCDIAMPSTATDVMSLWRYSTDILAAFSPSCTGIARGFEASFTLKMFGPCFLAIVFIATTIIGNLVGYSAKPGSARALCCLKPNIAFSCYGSLYFSFYIGIVAQTVSLFQCYKHPNGLTSMRSHEHVLCGFDYSPWNSIFIVGLLGFVCLGLGSLGFCCYIIYMAPRRYADPNFRARYKFLLMKYHPAVWWWSLVILAKALSLNFANVMFSAAWEQLGWLIAILILYMAMTQLFMPWRSNYANAADVAMHCMLIFTASLNCRFAGVSTVDNSELIVIMSGFLPFVFFGVLVALLMRKEQTSVEPKEWHQRAKILSEHLREALSDPEGLANALPRLPGRDYSAITWTIETLMAEVLGKQPQEIPVWPRLLLPREILLQQGCSEKRDIEVGAGEAQEGCPNASPKEPATHNSRGPDAKLQLQPPVACDQEDVLLMEIDRFETSALKLKTTRHWGTGER